MESVGLNLACPGILFAVIGVMGTPSEGRVQINFDSSKQGEKTGAGFCSAE